jgi:hypothetical protein
VAHAGTHFLFTLKRGMEEILPNGTIVEKGEGVYKFYYKPLSNSNNKKNTRKNRKYKCTLLVHERKSGDLHIQDFDCKGRGGGLGKEMFCASFEYLKEEPGVTDETKVNLTSMALKGEKEQEKLNNYYTRTYGFEQVGEMDHLYRTDMSTNIGTIIEKCGTSHTPVRSLAERLGEWFTRFRGGTVKKRRKSGRRLWSV